MGPEGGDDGGLGYRVDGEELEGAVLWQRIYLASKILYEKNNLWKNTVKERTCVEKFNVRSAMNHPAQRRHSPSCLYLNETRDSNQHHPLPINSTGFALARLLLETDGFA